MIDKLDRGKILRLFFALGLLDSAIALFVLLRFPSEVNDAVLFGYSWPRLVGAGLLGVAALGFCWFIVKSWRLPYTKTLVSKVLEWLSHPRLFFPLFFSGLLGYLFGMILLFGSTKDYGAPFYVYFLHLAPFGGWLAVLCVMVLFIMTLFRREPQFMSMAGLVLLLVILLAGIWINTQLWGMDDPKGDDIHAVFVEGQRLLEGKNPYKRVLEGDMKRNHDYATYFPISYYLSFGTQIAGLKDFSQWINFWQVIFLFFNLAIAILLFFIPYLHHQSMFAVFASIFWLFNRWTLHVSMSLDIDFMPIFLLVLSLVLFPRNQIISFLLFGLSLGIKHISIFLIPLFLLWAWQNEGKRSTKQVGIAALTIAIIPFLSSLPFVIWNWRGFFYSLLFSAVRKPTTKFAPLSLDALLGSTGLPAKIPMLLTMCLIYWLAWKNKINHYTAALLVFVTFVAFNSVLFPSYIAWVLPFIPLAAYELVMARKDMGRAM